MTGGGVSPEKTKLPSNHVRTWGLGEGSVKCVVGEKKKGIGMLHVSFVHRGGSVLWGEEVRPAGRGSFVPLTRLVCSLYEEPNTRNKEEAEGTWLDKRFFL